MPSTVHAEIEQILADSSASKSSIRTALSDLVAAAHEDDREIEFVMTAAHMLHEQAHGDDQPWRSCQQEPCRALYVERRGPAPFVLTVGD